MNAEITEAIGAAPYDRTDKRFTSRNGFREREWDTRVGTVELAIPKLRQGSYPLAARTAAPARTGAAGRGPGGERRFPKLVALL